MACAAVVSFPNARGDRASEWANERAWDEKKPFCFPQLLCTGAPWEGKEIYVFCLKLSPPIFYSFRPSLSNLLSFRACYTGYQNKI